MPEQSLGDLIVGLGADVKELRADVAQANKVLKGYEKSSEQSAKRSAKKTTQIGSNMVKQMAGVFTGAAMIGVTKSILKTSGSFQKSMQNVSTLIDKDVGPSISKLRKGILQMSREIPMTPNELGASAYDIFSAGISDTSQALKVLEASGKLAVAGLGEQKDAVDLMTSAINAFGLDASDADEVAAILFNTVKQGKTTVAEMTSQFGNVASAAVGANVTLADMQAQLAALTAVGVPTSQAQTRLAQAYIQTTKEGTKFASAMQKARITQEEFSKIIGEKGFVAALEMVRDKLKLSDVEFKKLFSSAEAGGAIFSLLTSANDNYRQSMAATDSAFGSFTAAFEKNKVGYEMALKDLNAAWQEYNISLMDATGGMSLAEAAAGTLAETLRWMAEGQFGQSIADQLFDIGQASRDMVANTKDADGAINTLTAAGEGFGDVQREIFEILPGMKTVFSTIDSMMAENADTSKQYSTDFVDITKSMRESHAAEVRLMMAESNKEFTAGWQGMVQTSRNHARIIKEINQDMADAVVMKSIIPDMVMGISKWFEKLPAAMGHPTQTAVDQTLKSFDELTRAGLGTLVGVETLGPAPERPDRKKTQYDIAMEEHQAQRERIRAEERLNDLLTQARASRLQGIEADLFRENELYRQQLEDFNAQAMILLEAEKINQEQVDAWRAEIDALHESRLQSIRDKEKQNADAIVKINDVAWTKIFKDRKEALKGIQAITAMAEDIIVSQWTQHLQAMVQGQIAGGAQLTAAFGEMLQGVAGQLGQFFIMEGIARIAQGIARALAGEPGGAALAKEGGVLMAAGAALQAASFMGGGGGRGGGGGGGAGAGAVAAPMGAMLQGTPDLLPAPGITPLAEMTTDERGLGRGEFILDITGLSDRYGNAAEISKDVFNAYIEQQGLGHVKVTVIED